jgi:large subunit ribosomal protein L21
MFAVIKTGGKQYRVAADDVIKVGKIAGNPGEIVQFGEVLVLGGDNVQLGTPTIAGAAVAGELLQHERGDKVIAFKKRRRKNSRRRRGYRHDFSVIRITEILTEGRQPTIAARPKAERRPAPAVEGGAAEGEAKPAAKRAKPAAKPAAKPKPPAKGKSAPKARAKPAAKAPGKPGAKGKPKETGKGKKK